MTDPLLTPEEIADGWLLHDGSAQSPIPDMNDPIVLQVRAWSIGHTKIRDDFYFDKPSNGVWAKVLAYRPFVPASAVLRSIAGESPKYFRQYGIDNCPRCGCLIASGSHDLGCAWSQTHALAEVLIDLAEAMEDAP